MEVYQNTLNVVVVEIRCCGVTSVKIKCCGCGEKKPKVDSSSSSSDFLLMYRYRGNIHNSGPLSR